MNVGEVMSTGVCSVQTETTLFDALKLMVEHRISGLPVVDSGGGLVGIVTEGDLLRRAETDTEVRRPRWLEMLTSVTRLSDEYVHSHGRRIGELMTSDPFTISPDATLSEAVREMTRLMVKRLPVVRDGKLVGIISRSDIVRKLLHRFLNEDRHELSDEQISAVIRQELQNQKWAPAGTVRVTVKDGIVVFDGVLTNEALRPALIVLAENVPGVKSVVDNVAWLDPLLPA